MKQVINVTFGGSNIAIEDTAYEKVVSYMDSLRQYFQNEEGKEEIVADIEARFAELMQEKLKNGAPHITEANVEELIATLGRPEDFDANATKNTGTKEQESDFSFGEKRRLYRDQNNKILGGVCSGIANWLNIDPTLVRIIFAIVSFGGFGTGIFIYLVLWVILPARSMDVYKGKRMYRDPDNKWLGGVASGISAYFNINPSIVRWVLAIPAMLSFLQGINAFGWHGSHHLFPLLFSGLTGTFIFLYIVLWIILPEATTPYQKMEMRGEHIDINTIKQNIQNSMGDVNERLKNWGNEVKDSAERFGQRAQKQFAYTARRGGQGLGYVLSMIIKGFFILMVSIIAITLMVIFLAFLFSGVAFEPFQDFLWTSDTQKWLAWASLILFIGAPAAGLVVWLCRRIFNIHTPGDYLKWTFSGLWAIGWICMMFFFANISRDFRKTEAVEETAFASTPSGDRLIFTVTEPKLRYEGNFGWLNTPTGHLEGISIHNNTLMISTVSFDFKKSDDSLFHINIIKNAIGKDKTDAVERAKHIKYDLSIHDSIIDLAPGIAVDKNSKYRFQSATVQVKVPAGKKIYIDESVFSKLSKVDINHNNNRRWNRKFKLVYNNFRSLRVNTDYIMQSDGILKSTATDDDSETSYDTNKENYRWKGINNNEPNHKLYAKPLPPPPPAPPAVDDSSTHVYKYDQSPSVEDIKKQELLKELERKQKEIEELRKKLEQ